MFNTKKSFTANCKGQVGGSPRADLVLQFIDGLRKLERYDAEVGLRYWNMSPAGLPSKDRLEVGVCTNSARLVARRFGGFLLGYSGLDNPTAQVAPHDFALCGTCLIDYWGCHYRPVSSAPMLDLSNLGQRRQAFQLYGDPEKWQLVEPVVEFRPTDGELKQAVAAGYDWFGRSTRTVQETLVSLLRSQGMDYPTANAEAVRAIAKMNKGFNKFTYGGLTLEVKHGKG